MASALRHSRDFMAHAIASVRSGVAQPGQEGPPIKVEPFDANNVSTAAGLLKLGTSISAARRDRANFQASQADAALLQEKTRAEIAKLRADAEYNLGLGRQTAVRAVPPQLTPLTQGPYAGMTPLEAGTALADRRIRGTEANRADMQKTRGRVAAASAGLRQLDLAAKRDSENQAELSMGRWAPVLDKAAGGDEAALSKLNIDPKQFAAAFGPQKGLMLYKAKQQIHDNLVAMHRIGVDRGYQPQRDRYQAILDEGAGLDSQNQGTDTTQGGGSEIDSLIQAIQGAGQD